MLRCRIISVMSATAPPAVERATAPVSALPPGPPLPMVAQAALWVLRPFPFMRWCRRRYGDIFSMRLPLDGDFVTVCDPAGIKAVFAADPDELHAGAANRILEPLLCHPSQLLLDGIDHLRPRRLHISMLHCR